MTPIVRPLITFCEYQGQTIMAAEIAELDVFSKPCYYTGKGKSKGSYIRVGDADLPMTEYEIYSYESFRQKKEDELRTKERISKDSFDIIQLDGFLAKTVTEYPVKALREIILNALIHRDYSYLTENDPIRIEMYSDRIEISNPGGLYGRLTLDDLGKARADVRNPFIASALEILETTENRYSGIPTIRSEMEKAGLMPPRFDDVRGTFKVTLYNSKQSDVINSDFVNRIKEFCKKPRTKEVLAKEFGYDEKHPAYFMNTLVKPLIDQGILTYTIPEKPKSKNQRIITAESE